MFSLILADTEGCCNKVFSSQAMSHWYKLRYHAFGASFFLRFSLHLIQIFVFIIPQSWKGDFIAKHEQCIQPFFSFVFLKPYINLSSLVTLTFAWHASIISRLLLFQIFWHFPKRQLSCQYVFENVFVFWTFCTFYNLPLFQIFCIHLKCTYHVRPVPILSICLFFFLTSLSFYILNSTDMLLSCQYATNLPLFQTFSIHLTCTYHVDNSLGMSPLTF